MERTERIMEEKIDAGRTARISFTVGLFLGIAEGVFFCVLASIL